MESPDSGPMSSKSRQTYRRLFWFLSGAVFNYLLIATPFKWLRLHTELPVWAVSGCSIAVGSVAFFFWNYFVNFRTDARKRDALSRYCCAVVLMWATSSGVLTLLKGFDARMHLDFGPVHVDLDVVATQFFLSWLKFLLYHLWVFPLPKDSPSPEPHPAAHKASAAADSTAAVS